MVDSKAWNWNMVKGDHEKYWQEPATESYYLINRWLSQNKSDFLDLGCGLGRHTIQFECIHERSYHQKCFLKNLFI